MSEERLPDQAPGAPHPRAVFDLFGHGEAEAALADALAAGRLHHAWMLTGPPGVGKATLAYRFARRYLGAAPHPGGSPLATSPDDPVARKIAAGAYPDLRTATRLDPSEGKVRRDVVVEAVRELTTFFELRADNALGRRIGIVDCADDMSVNAANALLKTLEEPPPGGLIILVVNSPGAILRTIRSRCRVLKLVPLTEREMGSAVPYSDPMVRAMARGCPGRAVSLAALDAGGVYRKLSAYLSGLPRAPLSEGLALADLAAASPEKTDLVFELLADWLDRAAHAGLGLPSREIEPGESAGQARLVLAAGAGAVAEAHHQVMRLWRATGGVNLDRAGAVLEALRAVRSALAPAAAAA